MMSEYCKDVKQFSLVRLCIVKNVVHLTSLYFLLRTVVLMSSCSTVCLSDMQWKFQ